MNVAEQGPLVETFYAFESQAQETTEDSSSRDDGALHALEEEIEVLASELEAAAQEGCDGAEFESLEEQFDGAVEAWVTLREARAQIASLRKDRGFKGPGVLPGREGHCKGDP